MICAPSSTHTCASVSWSVRRATKTCEAACNARERQQPSWTIERWLGGDTVGRHAEARRK